MKPSPRCIVIAGPDGKKPTKTFAATVGRALRRADQAARKTARAHGTPIHIWQDGKVVPQKP